MTLPLLSQAALVLTCILATWTDARRGIIPNWLTLPSAALGLAIHTVMQGWFGLGYAAAGALLCGLVPYLLFRRGAIGGGDVKLLAAVGALAGPLQGLEIECLAFVSASVFALARLGYHGQLGKTLTQTAQLALRPLLPSRYRQAIRPEALSTLRFGGAVLAGALLALVLRHTPPSWAPLSWALL